MKEWSVLVRGNRQLEGELTWETDQCDATATILGDIEALPFRTLLLRLEQLVAVPGELGFEQSNVISVSSQNYISY